LSLLVTFSRGSSPRVASVSDVLSTIPFSPNGSILKSAASARFDERYLLRLNSYPCI
jgi:hypothetical protein